MKNSLDLFLSTQNNYENFYYFHWFYPKPLHYHSHNDYFEIILPLKPEILHFFNNKTEKLDEKSIYIISPHYIHNIFCPRDSLSSEPQLFNLAISDDHFRNIAANISPSLHFFFANNNGLTKIQLTDVQFSYINSLAKLLKNCSAENRSNIVSLLLQNLFVLLSFQLESDSVHLRSNYALDVKMRIDSLEYIDKTAQEIYSKYPIAFSSLIYEFKKLTGQTIIHYLIDKRMIYAKKLLASTDYSVLEIACILGYNSLSHFICIFKKYHGITPKVYQLKKNIYVASNKTLSLSEFTSPTTNQKVP